MLHVYIGREFNKFAPKLFTERTESTWMQNLRTQLRRRSTVTVFDVRCHWSVHNQYLRIYICVWSVGVFRTMNINLAHLPYILKKQYSSILGFGPSSGNDDGWKGAPESTISFRERWAHRSENFPAVFKKAAIFASRVSEKNRFIVCRGTTVPGGTGWPATCPVHSTRQNM